MSSSARQRSTRSSSVSTISSTAVILIVSRVVPASTSGKPDVRFTPLRGISQRPRQVKRLLSSQTRALEAVGGLVFLPDQGISGEAGGLVWEEEDVRLAGEPEAIS